MKKPKAEFSEKRWVCPQCSYSEPPDLYLTERKHFDAHSLQCVRCCYRTETKESWEDAEAAYRRTIPPSEGTEKQP